MALPRCGPQLYAILNYGTDVLLDQSHSVLNPNEGYGLPTQAHSYPLSPCWMSTPPAKLQKQMAWSVRTFRSMHTHVSQSDVLTKQSQPYECAVHHELPFTDHADILLAYQRGAAFSQLIFKRQFWGQEARCAKYADSAVPSIYRS